MITLSQKLKEFDGRWKTVEQLSQIFEEIAKVALYGGHFLVESGDDSFELRLREVEFYFHSENLNESSITNTAMYHIGKNVDYFPIGSLYPHKSGVDITFEKEGHYRASFLVREYEYKDSEGNWKKVTRPTYFSEDLFGYTGCILGDGPKISWVDDEIADFKEITVNRSPRINLSKHDKDMNPIRNDKGEIVNNDRPWRFSRKTERK